MKDVNILHFSFKIILGEKTMRLKKTEKKVNESISPSSIGRSKAITDWAIDYIKDNLPDYEGVSTYGSDLGNLLTEGPNADGVYENDSWGFISSHRNDARDEYDYEMNAFGEVLHNPFEDPDGFVVCMLINTVDGVLSQVPFVDENWNNKFELTPEVIKEILDALK